VNNLLFLLGIRTGAAAIKRFILSAQNSSLSARAPNIMVVPWECPMYDILLCPVSFLTKSIKTGKSNYIISCQLKSQYYLSLSGFRVLCFLEGAEPLEFPSQTS
jgi:hypothetical protein